jgi:choline dehydrogenase-like flavoprotein
VAGVEDTSVGLLGAIADTLMPGVPDRGRRGAASGAGAGGTRRRGAPAAAGVVPTRGQEGVDALREAYSRTQFVVGPVQEVPSAAARVTLERAVTDRNGMPAVRLLATSREPNDLRTAAFLGQRAEEWLRASGARTATALRWALSKGPSAGQHQAGTCRMGADPRTSVTDQWGRVWGHDGVTVADGSLHVTNGGVNPVLTILALAWRNSEHLAGELAP